jgi:hypothetical protein
LPQEPQPQFEPTIIQRSSIEPDSRDFDPEQSSAYLKLVGVLSEQNAALKAENDRFKGELDFDKVKAKLITPYANKVFYFLCTYCLGVFIILMKSGSSTGSFTLPKEVLMVLSGSTAVAAIGLVGIVVQGLFSNR